MSSRRRAQAICALAIVATVATACGDDPTVPGDGAPTSAPADTLPPAGGTGTGEIVVDGIDFPFDADVCALTPVSHRGRAYDFYVHGVGTNGDGEYEVEVFRTAAADGTRVETLRVIPGASELIAATYAVEPPATSDKLQVNDSLVTGEMDFVSTNDIVTGSGIVNVACS